MQPAHQEELSKPSTSKPGFPEVVIVGFDVPFWGIVLFMVKVSFATIPAVILVYIICLGVVAILGMLGIVISLPFRWLL